MEQVYHLIVHRPKTVLFLIVLLTAFFAYHARQIRIDSSAESILPQRDPEKGYYDEIRRLFGSDDVAVIGLITDNIYTPQVLQKVKRLSDEFRKIPEVKYVYSLANAPDILAKVTGEEQDLFMPEIPTTAEGIEELKQKVANNPIYLKNLVSLDGKATAITITFLESINEDEFIHRGIDDKIQAIMDRENGPEQIYYTGLPHFKAYAAKAMRQNLSDLLPLALLLIMGMLLLCFRSLRGVLLPALTVSVSLIWTLGIMVLSGSALSLGSVMLPVLVLVIGTAHSLHVVAEYYEAARPGRPVDEVVWETLRNISTPVLIVALITFLGFFSQIVNQIVSIREMGIYSAIGITLAAVLSLTLVPALLMLLQPPGGREEAVSPRLGTALRRLVQGEIRYRRAVLTGSVLIALFAASQIPFIQVGSNFLSVFRGNHPVRQAANIVSQHLAGSLGFYVVIDGAERDVMKRRDTLRKIKDLQLYMNSLPGVDKTVSLVDFVEVIDNALQSLPPEEGANAPPPPAKKTTFWDNPAQLPDALQMIFLSPTMFSGFVNHPNYSRANIVVRTSLSRPSEVAALVEQIQAFAREHFPAAELTAHPTGTLILYTHATGVLIRGEVQSLALTAGVIFVIMSAIFLSVRVGVIGVIPNLYPILVLLGLMGVTGTILSVSTSAIALIALGLTVDNTVHLMTRLSFAMRAGADQEQALLQTLSTVGKTSLYVSSIFFLGFLALYLSTFVPIQEFGLLSATTMVVILAGNVVLLPALLPSSRILTVWDFLYTVTQLTQRLEQRVAERTRELQEVNRQLEAASRHKSEFLARMSHELRTPMNAIIGFTRLVMRRSKDILPKREHENLEKVLISAERLLALINDILDLSKIEAGRMEVHPVSFDLEPLIDGCLRTIESMVKSERLRLVKEVETNLPSLFTDQDRLHQILMNLLSNAIKFTEAGTITVTARCQDREVTISVADTGIGIPTDKLELIFEEFHQVDNSTTRQYSGTGLGLSISRHFAQLLGGDITAQSTIGVGSTFTVTIPLHYEAVRPVTPAVASSYEAVAATLKTGNVVLAIDDDLQE